MRINKYKSRFIFISMVLISIVSYVQAQLPTSEIVLHDESVVDLVWADDSSHLIFRSNRSENVSVVLDSDDWVQYDPIRQTITRQTTWPLQPNLTETEQQTFVSPISSEEDVSFIQQSPDNRYLVYASEQVIDGFGWSVEIGDRQEMNVLPTSALALSPYRYGLIRTIFSGDSTAFVLQTGNSASQSVLQYVSGYTTDSISVDDLSYIQVRGTNYYLVSAEQVSDDGQRILFLAYSDNGSGFEVVLWDVANRSQREVIGNFDNVVGATFVPSTENTILMVNELGLIAYDRATETHQILNPEIGSDWVSAAHFSPDGQWVALVDRYGNLYVERVQ